MASPRFPQSPGVLWLAALLLSAGCYDSHSVLGVSRDAGPAYRDGGGPIPGFDAGPTFRDGGGPIPGTDGGPTPGFDAGPGPTPTDGGGPVRRDAGPPPDAGPPSIALRFEAGDRLVVAPAPGLDLTEAFTLEMWIRPRAPGVSAISLKGTRATRRYTYALSMDGDELVAGWAANDAVHEVRAPVPIGVWTHVAMVVRARDADVATLQLVIDGELVAEGSFPNDVLDAVNGLPLVFGRGYEGDVDEIRLWRLARLPAGIRGTMGTRISGGIPSLEAYWPLEEAGQLALDHTLNGHDAVLGNFTTPDGSDPQWIRSGPI